jgi:hypothetical protein
MGAFSSYREKAPIAHSRVHDALALELSSRLSPRAGRGVNDKRHCPDIFGTRPRGYSGYMPLDPAPGFRLAWGMMNDMTEAGADAGEA